MSKLMITGEETGTSLVRRIEEHLFDKDRVQGTEFFVRAKNETVMHNADGWCGHDVEKVKTLALEFGIELETK